MNLPPSNPLCASLTFWLLIIFRHESPECLCGPGAAGGDVGSDQHASASVRLSRGRGGGCGGSGLPQQPAFSRLQVRTEQDRGHQGHGYGASVGPFLVRAVADWSDATEENVQTDDFFYTHLDLFCWDLCRMQTFAQNQQNKVQYYFNFSFDVFVTSAFCLA